MRRAPRIGSQYLGNVWQHAGDLHNANVMSIHCRFGFFLAELDCSFWLSYHPLYTFPSSKLILPTLHRILYPQCHKPQSLACCPEVVGNTLFYTTAFCGQITMLASGLLSQMDERFATHKGHLSLWVWPTVPQQSRKHSWILKPLVYMPCIPLGGGSNKLITVFPNGARCCNLPKGLCVISLICWSPLRPLLTRLWNWKDCFWKLKFADDHFGKKRGKNCMLWQ